MSLEMALLQSVGISRIGIRDDLNNETLMYSRSKDCDEHTSTSSNTSSHTLNNASGGLEDDTCQVDRLSPSKTPHKNNLGSPSFSDASHSSSLPFSSPSGKSLEIKATLLQIDSSKVDSDTTKRTPLKGQHRIIRAAIPSENSCSSHPGVQSDRLVPVSSSSVSNNYSLSQTTLYASVPLSAFGSVRTVDNVVSASSSVATTNTSGNGNLGTPSSQTTLPPRTPSITTAAGPSTSSWTNSNEQESDYVSDPVQGNTYYKGQFLGKGGFARVYMMTDIANGTQYACKIIPKNRMQKVHMQKIAREIMIHKELNHVNVVQMHHYFEDNLNAYMLLEACPRKSLMHVLKYRGKVTEPEARYYMKQMVTGVAYIHSQKVVHRDLKPGNMFLSEHMIVKIGDFGLATRPDGQRRRVTICGTPNYIAPEVLYKQAYSYEADVWALGCILYALLVGQPPFETATLKETYARICSNQYKEVDDSIATRSGQDLVRWLLQPTPELRPSLERVKEHAYLTKEYVPASLPHTCCYQMPPAHIIEPSAVPQTTLVEAQLTQSVSAMTIPKSSGRKEGKVNWLVKRLPKLPRLKQRLSSVFCPPEHKKSAALMQSIHMHRALDTCIMEIKCTCAAQNPPTVDDVTPLFVTKWIDYSNKYGLGFQLSDRSVGVLFNDSTKMSYTHDRRRVEYMTTDDEITRYDRERDVPVPLQMKLALLHFFTQYMDDHLTEGKIRERRGSARQARACVPRMRRWRRTDKAIVMELTIPLLQVNFFLDHTKMVVSQETSGRGYLITYIDAGRHTSSYWLNDLRDFGCTADLHERLHYVCKVSREFAELDHDMIA
ncbi:serine/threonine-protein kinase PLK1 isoform X2 [Cephus cinctus]|uniref:Serine/threonine-protein kinase PLK n=1 Tax=Cephus cinctus TaxID=211228 RepID=A0AAJ7FTF8_CEPCN|nr:serine/threonine-protein kinase PLK1 isoform X2 [Cephus cinctus]